MIPNWNISGVIPPIRPGKEGHSRDRSPYIASLSEVIERFATSASRIEILRGLLEYRTELRNRGVCRGFQWLNGSFMENKEVLLLEAPKDIDVVTFFYLPTGETQKTFLPKIADLVDVDNTKKLYHVDAYPSVLGEPLEEDGVSTISYWYSMWSHRRNDLWKGFVQINLSKDEDDIAAALIAQVEQELAKK